MSRTKHGSKSPGYEYMGKRPFNCVTPSAQNKKITHQKERAQQKEDLQKQIKKEEQ